MDGSLPTAHRKMFCVRIFWNRSIPVLLTCLKTETAIKYLLPYLNGFKSAALLDKGDNGYFESAGGIYTENVPIFTFITGKNKKNPIFFQNRFDFSEKSGILNDIITSGHSSVVEHHVANVMVVGSSPIARSIFFIQTADHGFSPFFRLIFHRCLYYRRQYQTDTVFTGGNFSIIFIFSARLSCIIPYSYKTVCNLTNKDIYLFYYGIHYKKIFTGCNSAGR